MNDCEKLLKEIREQLQQERKDRSKNQAVLSGFVTQLRTLCPEEDLKLDVNVDAEGMQFNLLITEKGGFYQGVSITACPDGFYTYFGKIELKNPEDILKLFLKKEEQK